MGKNREKRKEAPASGEPAQRPFHRDMLVIDALERDPRVQGVLESEGLPCHRCIVALYETLAQGCQPLGKSVDAIVDRLNTLCAR